MRCIGRSEGAEKYPARYQVVRQNFGFVLRVSSFLPHKDNKPEKVLAAIAFVLKGHVSRKYLFADVLLVSSPKLATLITIGCRILRDGEEVS